jgi:hypothetical protein
VRDDENRAAEGSSSQAWHRVGEQFDALGKSLARAFQEAWHDEANRQALYEVELGLKSMSRAVADAVDEAANSPEGQRLRADAERMAQSAHEAGKQAVDEARPQLLAAFQSMQQGLQAAIDSLQGQRRGEWGETGGGSPEP